MRTPNVGDECVSACNSEALGRAAKWRVTKVAKEADARDYVELEPINSQLQKKVLSVSALSNSRLLSRLPRGTKAAESTAADARGRKIRSAPATR